MERSVLISERQQMLTSQIRAIHVASRDTHGEPRIHAELAAQGLRCCVNTVARLVR
jgi:putative transposase